MRHTRARVNGASVHGPGATEPRARARLRLSPARADDDGRGRLGHAGLRPVPAWHRATRLPYTPACVAPSSPLSTRRLGPHPAGPRARSRRVPLTCRAAAAATFRHFPQPPAAARIWVYSRANPSLSESLRVSLRLSKSIRVSPSLLQSRRPGPWTDMAATATRAWAEPGPGRLWSRGRAGARLHSARSRPVSPGPVRLPRRGPPCWT
jgi:hypothetical protein